MQLRVRGVVWCSVVGRTGWGGKALRGSGGVRVPIIAADGISKNFMEIITMVPLESISVHIYIYIRRYIPIISDDAWNQREFERALEPLTFNPEKEW